MLHRENNGRVEVVCLLLLLLSIIKQFVHNTTMSSTKFAWSQQKIQQHKVSHHFIWESCFIMWSEMLDFDFRFGACCSRFILTFISSQNETVQSQLFLPGLTPGTWIYTPNSSFNLPFERQYQLISCPSVEINSFFVHFD